jgi:membrane-associated phospholipid phosphatase
MTSLKRGFAVLLLSALALPLQAQEEQTMEEDEVNEREVLAGDIATGVLPLATLITIWAKGDGEGAWQWFRNTTYTEVIVTGLRVAFNNTKYGERPNGHPYGFPSGHSGFVFSQAFFLQERYGWAYGVPAILIAGGISYIRVENDKHRWRDIIAAGVVAYPIALLTVTPDDATYIAPTFGPDWMGIRFGRSF